MNIKSDFFISDFYMIFLLLILDAYHQFQDAFFYSLVYDPVAMTLLADKGEIRVGDKYQCFVPDDGVPIVKEENKENRYFLLFCKKRFIFFHVSLFRS